VISTWSGFFGSGPRQLRALSKFTKKEAAVIELPDIVVPPDVPSPAPSPDLVESRPVMEEILEATPEPIPAPAPPVSKEGASVDALLTRLWRIFAPVRFDEDVEIRESVPSGLFVQAKPAQLQTAFEEIIKNAIRINA